MELEHLADAMAQMTVGARQFSVALRPLIEAFGAVARTLALCRLCAAPVADGTCTRCGVPQGNEGEQG